jgi:hypothetical protein
MNFYAFFSPQFCRFDCKFSWVCHKSHWSAVTWIASSRLLWYNHISKCLNGLNGAEECCSFVATERILKKTSITSLFRCLTRMLSCTRVWRMWWDSAGRLFWTWIRKQSHHRCKMMTSMKWTKQFCRFCPNNNFFVWQITCNICSSKVLYIIGVLILSKSRSDIFVRLLTSSSTNRRQVESSYRSNFAPSCYSSDIKDSDIY